VSGFIDIPPLSTEISRHRKLLLTDGKRTNGRATGIRNFSRHLLLASGHKNAHLGKVQHLYHVIQWL